MCNLASKKAEPILSLYQRILVEVVGVPADLICSNVKMETLKQFSDHFESAEAPSTDRSRKVRADQLNAQLLKLFEEVELHKIIVEHARQLIAVQAKNATSAGGNEKFGELVLGDAACYFAGLGALIGPPDHLDLGAAVKREHSSDTPFTAPNYKVETTPRAEWELVYGGPKQEPLTGGVNKNGESMKDRYGVDLEHMSRPDTIADLINKADLGFRVTEAEVRPLGLTKDEIACLRMYTGDCVRESSTCLVIADATS